MEYKFNETFNEICKFLYTEAEDEHQNVVKKYFEEMTRYTCVDGKQNRFKFSVDTVKNICVKDNTYENILKLANVLGCCIEIMQASFLIHDDIMDNSLTRRNRYCWYIVAKEAGNGLIAVNDGLQLNAVLMKILKFYFSNENYYLTLIEMVNEVVYNTIQGQCLDMITSRTPIDWQQYTIERYMSIVKYKTAFYSFYLPVAGAMLIAGISEKAIFQDIESILLKMGEYFQIQDDYLDCYGDFQQLGKIGRDIEEGKCSWLIIKALSKSNKDQIEEIKKNYGSEDSDKVCKIKSIFEELDLAGEYKSYQNQIYNELITDIERFSNKLDNSKVWYDHLVELLHKIYNRTK